MRKWMGFLLILSIPVMGVAQTFVVMKGQVQSANPKFKIPANACLEMTKKGNTSLVHYFGYEIAVPVADYTATSLKYNISRDSTKYFSFDEASRILTVTVTPIRESLNYEKVNLTDSNGITKNSFVHDDVLKFAVDTLPRLLRLTGKGMPDIFFQVPPLKPVQNEPPPGGGVSQPADTTHTGGAAGNGGTGTVTVVVRDSFLWLWILGGIDAGLILLGLILAYFGFLKMRIRFRRRPQVQEGEGASGMLSVAGPDPLLPPAKRKKPLNMEDWTYQTDQSLYNVLVRLDDMGRKVSQLSGSGGEDRKIAEQLRASLQHREQELTEKNTEMERLMERIATKERESMFYRQLTPVLDLQPVASGLHAVIRMTRQLHERALKFYMDKRRSGNDGRVAIYTAQLLAKYQAAVPANIDRWDRVLQLLGSTGLLADADLIHQLTKQRVTVEELRRQFRNALAKDFMALVNAMLILLEELQHLNRLLGEENPDTAEATSLFASAPGALVGTADKEADLKINYLPLFSDSDKYNHITTAAGERSNGLYPDTGNFRRDQVVQIVEFGMQFKSEGEAPRTKIVTYK